MNSNGKRKDAEPFHWTLLVLDQKARDWLHYNSSRPTSAKTVDHYFEDVRIMKQYVENYNYVNVEETRPYGAPLLSVEDAPQQKMGSVDCGVIICYLMKQITQKQVIASKLPQSIVDSLRAEIVSKFMNDPHRSWSIQNFHARQQAANDDFEQ
ncbi:hypothetical protein MRB53_016221 [Persea americana]|uniref:Uncharacterized protein n=1 Tax=Persea americana TaxID=3435 RepID=A0ACC2M2W1_PERAE|nr:hypothetical protein MRB53_016221 [Persea americana]